MGDFTLGCLLGQYDGAQSFDVASDDIGSNINSWGTFTSQGSFFFQSTDVHSSSQGLRVDVGSTGGVNYLFYNYNFSNDFKARKSPFVNSHNVTLDVWSRLEHPLTNARVNVLDGVGNQFTFINQAEFLEHHRVQTVPASSAATNIPAVSFSFLNLNSGTNTIYIDDVIFQVDPITLRPEISFKDQAQLIKTDHTTRGGERHTHVWGKNFNFSVPLRYVSNSHANLLNWWWENKFPLAFTLDTSDSESTYVVRIANNTQPMGKRVLPYQDKWQGLLQLESVNDGSLVF